MFRNNLPETIDLTANDSVLKTDSTGRVLHSLTAEEASTGYAVNPPEPPIAPPVLSILPTRKMPTLKGLIAQSTVGKSTTTDANVDASSDRLGLQ